MTDRLTGKKILVTGAASGIGRQVATRFVAEGARVAFADRDQPGAATAAQAALEAAGAGAEALAIDMDITDEQSVTAAYAAVADRGWTLDVVVANAGVQLFGRDAKAADLDLDVWKATVDVNLTGTFLTVKHAVRGFVEHGGGSLILTGSPTGLNGEGQDFTAYSTTKAGIHGMARTVAAAYAGQGVRANVVVPGYTETPLVTTISGDPSSRAAIVSRTPLGRPGRPEDVEGIMVYLASDESSFATGAIFRVDGGMTSL
ncbi:SDR family NAD(P)-dependent oxidoreductase [Frondihabitans australicus]|uniref:NAD(P)-dependent dehydrogenase (Short-subunit alcohol dehydrogenase family) n=1 Tax=Frondihabitans australicus TaxID=386892 RepID=A0A495ILE1_9MICO|nr:SDR family NAD(P)-dependent oxidoreductase [Frondihabitans australicus]RKR75976.1 NAD(P)-dependent dehydrogenase (short-subunit alcohol dehydrogenase family) [Frondihabitans australicus]